MTSTNQPGAQTRPYPADPEAPEHRSDSLPSVVLADPPWATFQTGKLGASRHYDLMTMDQIMGMGEAVKAVTAETGHLWLFVTNATLRDGYTVAERWGYTPRSLLTWVKPRFTLGNYLRNATEHVIFATRGKAPVQFKSQPTWAYWPLLEHSVKPDEVYSIIDRVSGRDTKKLELFARRRPPVANWSVWGNEIESDVSLAKWGYPVPSDFARQDQAAAPSADGDGEA